MKGHGSQYEQKKEAAISALLTQRSIEDAARSIDVGPSTLRRWMRMPDFEADYRQARREAMGQSIARLQQNSGVATTNMLKLMIDPATPPACRLNASRQVIELGFYGLEVEDMQARVAALERKADVRQIPEGGDSEDEQDDEQDDFEQDKAA
jgi:transposase-like protein